MPQVPDEVVPDPHEIPRVIETNEEEVGILSANVVSNATSCE